MGLQAGDRIKAERMKQGLSQNKLAKLANVAQSTLCDIEKNRNNPSLDTVILIANALKVPVTKLMDNENASQEDEMRSEFLYLISALREDQRKNLLQYARFLLNSAPQT